MYKIGFWFSAISFVEIFPTLQQTLELLFMIKMVNIFQQMAWLRPES
jgi:hypothetical protein